MMIDKIYIGKEIHINAVIYNTNVTIINLTRVVTCSFIDLYPIIL